jgi:hypothetical protein
MALKLLDRVVGPNKKRKEKKVRLGADAQYQEAEFIKAQRERKVPRM